MLATAKRPVKKLVIRKTIKKEKVQEQEPIKIDATLMDPADLPQIPQHILETALATAKHRPQGRGLLSAIMVKLQEPAMKDVRGPDGKFETATRLDVAADAYVRQMELGSFIHNKEIVERQEGKVPNRVAGADGDALKLYIGLPVDDQHGAP